MVLCLTYIVLSEALHIQSSWLQLCKTATRCLQSLVFATICQARSKFIRRCKEILAYTTRWYSVLVSYCLRLVSSSAFSRKKIIFPSSQDPSDDPQDFAILTSLTCLPGRRIWYVEKASHDLASTKHQHPGVVVERAWSFGIQVVVVEADCPFCCHKRQAGRDCVPM